MRSIEGVLGVMEGAPADFVMQCSRNDLSRAFSRFKHRWIGGGDIARLLLGARGVIERHGSIEGCFAAALEGSHADVLPALASFVDEMSAACGGDPGRVLAAPCRGSACKRLNLFLRWMVRRDEVDTGGWRAVPAAKLIVPLDTHMFRMSRALGLTDRRHADLKAAREVTDAFREIAPDDPVKYDFALTRIGMLRGPERDAAFPEVAALQ